MAVTKIWPIRRSLSAPIEYVSNEEKTANPDAKAEHSQEELQALDDVIEYAANEDKTELKYFVSTLNCNKAFARDEFQMVKQRFDKEGGIVAFHGYQSFKQGEVTPQEAHEIGIRLAEELWGERFQVVIATHVNTKCAHNHFVINSVSFKDGKRYHDCRETYQRMREVSDRICRERGLSTIDKPRGKGVNQYLYKMEQAGMPTRHNVARQAIDEAVALSVNMEEFKSELRKRGYQLHFDPSRKYWGLVPPGWKKTIRIHKLGNEYTRERIEERIADNDISIRAVRLRQQYHIPNNYSLKRRIDRIMGRSGLEKLYLRYCYELGYLPKYRQSPTKLHIALKEDLLKCDQYSEQAKLLSRYHISTDEDLSLHEAKVEEKMTDITARRDELRRKARHVLPEEEITETKEQIKALTSELKRLRREVKVCGQIRERSGHVRENLATIDRDRQKQKEQER